MLQPLSVHQQYSLQLDSAFHDTYRTGYFCNPNFGQNDEPYCYGELVGGPVADHKILFTSDPQRNDLKPVGLGQGRSPLH